MADTPKQTLGLTTATTIIIGSMIGSGIMLLPATMLGYLPSPILVMGVFVVAAIMTIVGSLTVSELSGMFPGAGGQYLYLRETYGKLPAYLFGWTTVWIVQTGTIAAVAAAFAKLLGRFIDLPGHKTALIIGSWHTGIDLPPWGETYLAVGVIALLSIVNFYGVRFGGIVQNLSTFAKGAGLALIVALVFLFAHPIHPFSPVDPPVLQKVEHPAATIITDKLMGSGEIVGGFFLALSLCLFMYDGWYSASYVAAEVKNPRRNVPLALILGPLITTAIYLAVAGASLFAVPLKEALNLPDGDFLAGHAVVGALGNNAGTIVTILALVSIFGTVNAFVLTSPRIMYAFSRDGYLLRSMGNLDRKRGTPGWGLVFSGLWSCILVFTGAYDQLANMVIFAVFLFHVPTAWAHIKLRRERPDAERPYRTPGGPIIPILYLLTSVAIIVSNLVLKDYRVYSILALGVIAIGVPAFFWQERNPRPAEPTSATHGDEQHV
jgi:APA family basic amino acid/polyamine antiporter